MPRPRKAGHALKRRELDFDQKFDLTAGRDRSRPPGTERSPWSSEAERRAAWEQHAAELISWPRLDWSRAEGWWAYTAGIPDDLRLHPHSADLDENDTLDERRWRWLAATDGWLPGEQALVEERRRWLALHSGPPAAPLKGTIYS